MKRAQQEAYKRDYAQAKAEGKPFFPYAIAKDTVVATLAVGIIIVLAVVARVEVGEPVNAATTDYVPRPEWYFFFLFELLKVFEGENVWTPVIMATFIIPNILMVILIVWPFIDRGPERRIWKRPVSVVTAVAVIAFLGYMTYLGATTPTVGASGTIELQGLDPQAQAGLELYLASGCTACHMVKNVGAPGPGPDLTNEGAKNRGVEWQIAHLKNPQSRIPGSTMPAFTNFTPEQYDDIAIFLDGLGTKYR
jgi:mono/diheme cytochrome c family protein